MAMSRYEALARRLVLVLGLGAGSVACEGNGPLPNDPAPAAAAEPTPVAAAATPPPSEAAPPTTPPAALAALEAQADAALAHLRALQIVEVRDLVLHLPDASSACYGPCPTAAWDAIVTQEYRRQVPRLLALSGFVDGAIYDSYPVPIATTGAPQDVQTLNALAIVELGALLVAEPANNPRCYFTPCPEDVQQAATDTGMRAFYLHMWASRAHTGGI